MEQRCADLEKQCKLQDKTTQALSSRIFTLELRDMPHKIDETIREAVREAVHVALQAPLRDRFRELPEADMKEILHQRMFESGTYKSLPEHVALYEALEASMKRANRHEFLAEKDNSKQPLAPQSSAWKTSDTREAPSSSSEQEDTDIAHLPKIKTKPDWLKPIPEEDIPASPKLDWFQMEEYHLLLTDQVDLVNREGHRVVPDVSKPLPFRGPPGQWFKRKEFYITKHSAPSDRSTVRSYMRILSVASLKTYERYGYTFLKEIILCRADYKEYKISEADFKNPHPNDFEDMYLLHLQSQLNHLSGADKVHLFNADASKFLFKEDYTIVSKPRAVIYRDRTDQKKMMRETEVHKFSDGMLNRIMDKLDHMVKDFKLFKFNSGMETRI
ncbi:hypothetical protein Tco_1451329 [Tanacetum coccineum]